MVNFRSKYFAERLLDNTDSKSNSDVVDANEKIQEKCKVSGCLKCDEKNSTNCTECFRGFKLISENGKCQVKDEGGKNCDSGEYKYNGIDCVKNKVFDSNCDNFTDGGNGPVCDAEKCRKGYGLSMPYFGGICVKCPENCDRCSNSYSCIICESNHKLTDRKKCVKEEDIQKENDEEKKKTIKGCTSVKDGKCVECENGFKPNNEGNKCEIKTYPTFDQDKDEKEQKQKIGKIFFEREVMENKKYQIIIIKMYKYILETKLNIDGYNKASKNYYIFGPKRFSLPFKSKYKISKKLSRRSLNDDDYTIELNCSPVESEESEGEGIIHNVCESDEGTSIEPDKVFCNECTIEAEPVDGGLSLPKDIKKDDELPAEISNKTIDEMIEEIKTTETIKLKNFNIDKNDKASLIFGDKKPKKGVEIIIFITFIKESRRNRILEEDEIIQVAKGSIKSTDEEPTEGKYERPSDFNEKDEIIDAIALSSGEEDINIDMTTDEINNALKNNNGDSNPNPITSSSGLSGGAIAAIVIVSCVVVIAVIAIVIAIKTKAIGEVKTAYETANNFSSTSGKTVQPEQVYI